MIFLVYFYEVQLRVLYSHKLVQSTKLCKEFKSTFCPSAFPLALMNGSRVILLYVNLLTVNCSMFGR